MKRLTSLLIITLLVTIGEAQVRNYKQNQEYLLTALQTGEISKDAYISMTTTQLSGLKDSVHIQVQKPHYNATLDLMVVGGGVLYQKFGKNVKYDYVLHFWGAYFATKGMNYGLDRMGFNKTTCALVPPVITSALCLLKEYVMDSQVSNSDLYAGIGGGFNSFYILRNRP